MGCGTKMPSVGSLLLFVCNYLTMLIYKGQKMDRGGLQIKPVPSSEGFWQTR